MKKTLALFDFDGTLYQKNSLIEFTKFAKGKTKFYKGLLILSPYLIAMILRIISNEKAKKKYIQHFFKNESYDTFKSLGNDFSITQIPKSVNLEIFSKFISHLNSNHTVFIVTASLPEWIIGWSNQYNIQVIGTEIEVVNNRITGCFSSRNCYGLEKTNRINTMLDLKEFDSILVYGSGRGDREMLKLSKVAV